MTEGWWRDPYGILTLVLVMQTIMKGGILKDGKWKQIYQTMILASRFGGASYGQIKVSDGRFNNGGMS